MDEQTTLLETVISARLTRRHRSRSRQMRACQRAACARITRDQQSESPIDLYTRLIYTKPSALRSARAAIRRSTNSGLSRQQHRVHVKEASSVGIGLHREGQI